MDRVFEQHAQNVLKLAAENNGDVFGKAYKVANETGVTVQQETHEIRYRLYTTTIFTIKPSGEITLHDGRGQYQTKLTRNRINKLLPAGWRVYIQYGIFFLTDPKGNVHSFYDGITIRNGEVLER